MHFYPINGGFMHFPIRDIVLSGNLNVIRRPMVPGEFTGLLSLNLQLT